MPECCKTGRIQPLLKKGCKTDIVNYHPISNLSWLSKVFERMLFLFTKDIQTVYKTVWIQSTPQYGKNWFYLTGQNCKLYQKRFAASNLQFRPFSSLRRH